MLKPLYELNLADFLANDAFLACWPFLQHWLSFPRLQKFKLNIANTIVNQDNSSLTTMATDQLLDLFSLEIDSGKETTPTGVSPSKGLKSMLQNMTELWDESEYDTEYDVTNFLATLGKKWSNSSFEFTFIVVYFNYVEKCTTQTENPKMSQNNVGCTINLQKLSFLELLYMLYIFSWSNFSVHNADNYWFFN